MMQYCDDSLNCPTCTELEKHDVPDDSEMPLKVPPAETRVVDPTTGAEKGSKLARFDLIPVEALEALATHFGVGAKKYADRNWERGYAWHLSFAALMRHAWAYWRGEDTDAETGTNHMIAVAWHAFALYTFNKRKVGTDDRVK